MTIEEQINKSLAKGSFKDVVGIGLCAIALNEESLNEWK